MVFEEKGTPYLGKQLGKKLLAERVRAAQQEVEEQQRQTDQAAQQAVDAKPKIYLDVRGSGKGAHHCSRKDAGTTHKFCKKCIDDKHMGVCEECHAAADPFDGCSGCGCKGDDLKYENIVIAPSQHEIKKLQKAEFKASRKAAQSLADQPQAKRRKRS